MTNFINTAETGLANNVDITTANSGSGSAGTAFTVTKGAGGTFKMDTAIKHRGAASYKMVCAVDGDSARADLILGAASNSAAVEGYFYLTAYPSAETSLLNLRSAAGSVAFININSTGQVRLFNQAGVAAGITTNSVPLNAWFRCHLGGSIGGSATTGSLRTVFYSGANLETTTIDTNSQVFPTAGTVTMGTSQITQMRAGKTGSGTIWTVNMDDLQWSDTSNALIGPVTGSPPHVGYTRQSVVEIDASSTSGTGTLTLVQQSGPTVSISGPVANVFRVILPNPMATAAVVRLTSTDGATSDFQDITITPTGGSTTVLARDFLVHNGTAYV
jgi:hypothetical protein